MQSEMEFRISFLFIIFGGIFQIIISCFIWTAIYKSKTVLYGYTYTQMITYSVMAGILTKIMLTQFQWGIAIDIKNGGLSKYIVQPISYFLFKLSEFFGRKIIQLVTIVVITSVLVFILNFGFNFRIELKMILIATPVILLSLILNSLLFYCMSLLAFWLTEVGAAFVGLGVAMNILSGGIFPLEVFGLKLERLFNLLPFKYIIYFPLNIINSRIDMNSINRGILLQCIWIIVLLTLVKILWNIGMKKYISAGG
jgi:ABC-2 type transport system permease protein